MFVNSGQWAVGRIRSKRLWTISIAKDSDMGMENSVIMDPCVGVFDFVPTCNPEEDTLFLAVAIVTITQ